MRTIYYAVFAGLLSLARPCSATNVFTVVNSGSSAYIINGINNPTLNLVRGSNYTFTISTFGSHPFWIKTVNSVGTGNAFNTGVTSNGIADGTLTFAVPPSAPTQLFYNCQFHSGMTGNILITDPPPTPVPPVTKASDVSTNAAYAGGFNNGSNGGFGFEPWVLVGSGTFSGGFIGNSTQNGRTGVNVNATAFGLYANPTPAVSDARRVFSGGALRVGETFSFDMNVSWNGGDRGFILYQGAYTNDRLKINHGGSDAMYIQDEVALTNVFNRALRVAITVLSRTGLNVQVTGAETFSTNVAVAGLPDRFKFYYANTANDGANEGNYEPYFNNLVLTGPATRYVALGNPAPSAPYTNWVTAATNIQDAIDAADLGALILVSNGTYQTGGRVADGQALTNRVTIDKTVTVESVNGPAVTIIRGIRNPLTDNGDAAVRCVWMGAGASLSGFTLTNGATRASGAGTEDESGGGVWDADAGIVSNCVLTGNTAIYGGGAANALLYNCSLAGNSAYSGGGVFQGELINCTLTSNSASYGGGAVDATLNNCTVAGNSADDSGGGTFFGALNNCTLIANTAVNNGGGASDGTSLSNCVLIANSADYGGGVYSCVLDKCTLTANAANGGGGGAYASLLNNCTLVGNTAGNDGGGTFFGALNNCTVVGNSAGNNGGGTCFGELNNCIVYFNSAVLGSNWNDSYLPISANTCTTPLPTGSGNITNDPLFVSLATTNLALSANSPCINLGLNALAPGTNDIAGQPRIANTVVDLGAYEYQGAANPDYDGDGWGNADEYIAETDPTSPTSFFEPIQITNAPAGRVALVIDQTSTGRVYGIYANTNLLQTPQVWTLIQPEQTGTASTLTLIATNTLPQASYRTGVRLP